MRRGVIVLHGAVAPGAPGPGPSAWASAAGAGKQQRCRDGNSARRPQLALGRGLAPAEQGHQRLGQRPERHQWPDRAAAAAQYHHVGRHRPADRLGQQPRLADARLADEEDRASPALARSPSALSSASSSAARPIRSGARVSTRTIRGGRTSVVDVRRLNVYRGRIEKCIRHRNGRAC